MHRSEVSKKLKSTRVHGVVTRRSRLISVFKFNMNLVSIFVFICVTIACASANFSDLFKSFRKPKTTTHPRNYCKELEHIKLLSMNDGKSIFSGYDLMVRHLEEQCARQRANLKTDDGPVYL